MQLNASDLGDSNALLDELDKLAAESIDDIQPREIKDVVIPVEIHPDPPPKNEPKPEPKPDPPKQKRIEITKNKHKIPRKPQMKITLDDLPPVVLPSSPLPSATHAQEKRESPTAQPIIEQSVPQAKETYPKVKSVSKISSVESSVISYLDKSLKNLKENFKIELENILTSTDNLNSLVSRFSKNLTSEIRSEIVFRAEPYQNLDVFDFQIDYTRPNYRIYPNTDLLVSMSEIKARQITYKEQLKARIKEFRTIVHDRNQAVKNTGQRRHDLKKQYRGNLVAHYSLEAQSKIIEYKIRRMRNQKNDIISRSTRLNATEQASSDDLISDEDLSDIFSQFFTDMDTIDSLTSLSFAREFIDGEIEDQTKRRELVDSNTEKFISIMQEASDGAQSIIASRCQPENRSLMSRTATITGDSLIIPLSSFVY